MHYKYAAQSSHRHKTCTVAMTVAVHLPYIQTLCTHGVVHRAAMKTVLSAGCGLSYQSLLPGSVQKNMNKNITVILVPSCIYMLSLQLQTVCSFLATVCRKKTERVLPTAEVQNSTRFHNNCLKTFHEIPSIMNKHTQKHYLLGENKN